MYYEVDVMLSTDGGGVMGAKLKKEYAEAKDLIDKFKQGKQSLMIDGKERHWDDLSPEEAKRFSLSALQESTARYHQLHGAKD